MNYCMNIESMPDEIFLEIFDYISSCDLIYAFYNLNERFNSIIRNIRLYLDLSCVQQKTFLFSCHYILPKFYRQIYSIKLSNKQTIDGINYYLEQSTYNQKIQVKTLILIEPTLEQLNKLMVYHRYLKNLIIKTTDYLVIPIEFISDSLRVCRILNCQIDTLSSNISEKIFCLEELNFKISNINKLFSLLDSMIYLKRLTCSISESEQSLHSTLRIPRQSLIFLNYLKLNVCSISFNYIEILLSLCPNIVTFIYKYKTGIDTSYDNQHIDIERWDYLLTSRLNKLRIFDLHISLNIDARRDLMLVAKQFQNLVFFLTNNIRIVYEITSYKHILCTVPLSKAHFTNFVNRSSTKKNSDPYSRIRHFDWILNQTVFHQQQHTIRCPLVHSFCLGLYDNIAPIEHQSRLLLNQSISFVYLKHFELYGTCLTNGFSVLLLTKMTNLNSLTLPLNHLISCQMNETVRENMKRIKRLQLTLIESLTVDCVKNLLIPIFPNLHSMSFAIDNRIHSFERILLTMIGQSNNDNHFKYMMFLEVFALDQDWDHSQLVSLRKFIRYKNNYRFLYIWL